MLIALIKGIVIGFTLAAPVGPIGILCIRRTLAEGRRSAVSTMLGAATADALYGVVAAFGITLVTDFITDHALAIRLVGGIILVILGLRTIRAHIPDVPQELSMNDHAGNFISTLILTLTNPLTFFAFAAVFAGAGTIGGSMTTYTAVILVAGVFLGSLLWFGCLSTATHFFSASLKTKGLDLINRISGTLITIAGLVALSSFLW